MILIDELTYHFVPWRRAIYQLKNEQCSWLLYCYGDYRYNHEQLAVVPYVWNKFLENHREKKISKKVKKRLQSLVLLAIQVAKNEIKG